MAFDDYCNLTHETKNEMTAIIGSTQVLKCPVGKHVSYAWEKFNGTIAEGTKINPDYRNLNKFAIDSSQTEYNLMISNISTHDSGQYCCDQIDFRCCLLLHVQGNSN